MMSKIASLETACSNEAASVTEIEVNSGGKWIKLPALLVRGQHIIVRGKWLKIAEIHDENWLETEVPDPSLCIKCLNTLESRGLHADLFTFSQLISDGVPKYKYPLEWESVAAVKLSKFKEWWDKLPQETRKNVRRSQKRGVVVSVQPYDEKLIHDIMEVNNESPTVQGAPSRYFGKAFEEVKRDHSAFLDRSDFICAYVGTELVGFLKLVYRGDIASILGFLSKASHFDKRPANALISAAVQICESNNIVYLIYGNYNYGNKRDSPLRQFKVRNGFEEVLVPRYYVPLTVWGEVCRRLRFHRGLLGILPHNVIAFFIRARARLSGLSAKSAGVAQ